MLSYHNNQELKKELITRVDCHAKADRIIKGRYWEDGKGCAIGCMTEKNLQQRPHLILEKIYGVPQWLGIVVDKLFEGMPNEDAMKFPLEIVSSISVGVDLNQVKAPFLIYILESALNNFNHEKFPSIKKYIEEVIHLYKMGDTHLDAFKIAHKNAAAATDADAAAAAAYAAATGAYAAYAYAYAAAAADADAAATGAYAAYAYAYAAAAADAAVAAAYTVDAAAGSNKHYEFSRKLLSLIQECK